MCAVGVELYTEVHDGKFAVRCFTVSRKKNKNKKFNGKNKEPNMCKMVMIAGMLRLVILLVQYFVLAVMSHS